MNFRKGLQALVVGVLVSGAVVQPTWAANNAAKALVPVIALLLEDDAKPSSTEVNDDVVVVDDASASTIVQATPAADDNVDLELSGSLASSAQSGKLITVLPGADNRFPLGFSGRVSSSTQNPGGTKTVQLTPVSYADVVAESSIDLSGVTLDANNFVGVISPNAVQAAVPSSGAPKAKSIGKPAFSFRHGAIIVRDASSAAKAKIGGGVVNAGTVSLNMKVDLGDMDVQASTMTPVDANTSVGFVITGALSNIKLTNKYDFSLSNGLTSLDLGIEGDFDFDVKFNGKGHVKFGYFSRAWNEVKDETFSVLGVTTKLTGLSSTDKIGKYPLAGLVWSVPCPNTCPVVTGTTQTPLRQAKAMGVIVWLYLTLDGELTVDGDLSLAKLYPSDLSLGLKKSAGGSMHLNRSLTKHSGQPHLVEAPGFNGTLNEQVFAGMTADVDFFAAGVRIANAGIDIGAQANLDLVGQFAHVADSLSGPWNWEGNACVTTRIGAGAIFRAAASLGIYIDTSWGDVSGDYDYSIQIPTDAEMATSGLHAGWYTVTGANECWPRPVVNSISTTVSGGVATITVNGQHLPSDLQLFDDSGLCSAITRTSLTQNQAVFTCAVTSGELRYRLSSVMASNLSTASATGLTYNYAPTEAILSLSDASLTEGDTGNSNMQFNVSLNEFLGTATVDYTTQNGTAQAGTDFIATSGILSFTGGSTAETINVPVIGDTLAEGNETFSLLLSNPSGIVLSDSSATGTILDDDGSTHPLNDTGIDWGGDYSSGNNATCTSNITGPQDCDQGRDATHDDDSDGHAGFSFTKLDTNGNPLPASATSWSCVKDNVTGLIWEVKTDDGSIHDKDNTYRWGGVTHLGSGFGTYYNDWDSLVNDSNSASFCGGNNWRVPTLVELQGLVDYSRTGPAIDVNYFPNTLSSLFWSASPYADYSYSAWLVYFYYGYAYGYNRSNYLRVRLVRSGQ